MKLMDMNQRVIHSLGKMVNMRWEFSKSVGATSGLISIWSNEAFILEEKIISTGMIVLIRWLKKLKLRCGLVNVYAPNDEGERL
ncbi:hypothetical protein REPUB_Repub20aG0103100 [Reevesia pubescens]